MLNGGGSASSEHISPVLRVRRIIITTPEEFINNYTAIINI
jgi:hypothetical protein